MIEAKELKEILPQSFPFMMIDRVVEFEKGKRLVAIKNITGNEWVFEGQDYDSDIFPEVLIIEAAAQAELVLHKLTTKDKKKFSNCECRE